jgi:hypothetical protein
MPSSSPIDSLPLPWPVLSHWFSQGLLSWTSPLYLYHFSHVQLHLCPDDGGSIDF